MWVTQGRKTRLSEVYLGPPRGGFVEQPECSDHHASQKERDLCHHAAEGLASAKAGEQMSRPRWWRFDLVKSQDSEEMAQVDGQPIPWKSRPRVMRTQPGLPVAEVNHHPSQRLGGRDMD